MGVGHVWLFDPKDLGRVMLVHEGVSRWTSDPVLGIEGTDIAVDLNRIQKRASRSMQ